MNVLIVGLGGVTATFRNWPERILALALARRGHTVRAIGYHDPQRPALAQTREVIDGVQVQRVRSGYWPNRELHAALEAGPLPDMIHFMHPRNVLAQQVSRWAAKRSIPTAYTWLGPFHDAYLVPDRERPFDTEPAYANLIWTRRQLMVRWLQALNPRQWRDELRNYRLHAPLKAATVLIPCSQFEAAEMRRMGLTQPLEVVPLWIDTPAIEATPVAEPTVTAARPWLLFVGQITPRKGYDLALHALPLILQRYPTASLLIVSGINHAEQVEVERISEQHGMREHVHFLGRVDDATLINLFRACDVYLTPTRYEGFGLTLLEAMAAHAPVVSSNIPVVDEIVQDGENGLLARYNDAEAVAEAALRLLDDRALRERIVAQGVATVARHYHETHLIAQIEAIYERAQRGTL